jgi:large subunit ribosomal protein L21
LARFRGFKACGTAPAISRNDCKKPVRNQSEYRDSNTRKKKMFAVFKTGGKQYRVAADDVLKVDKIKGEPGDIVEFGEVLVLGGDSVKLGSPMVSGATVAAEVLDQKRSGKIIAFKKRRRKNSRRKIGHRQEFTLVRITEILTDGKKPSKKAEAKARRAPAATAGTGAATADAATPSGAASSAEKPAKPKAAPEAKKPAAAAAKKGKKK